MSTAVVGDIWQLDRPQVAADWAGRGHRGAEGTCYPISECGVTEPKVRILEPTYSYSPASVLVVNLQNSKHVEREESLYGGSVGLPTWWQDSLD